MKVLNFSGQAGFAKRKGRKATQRTQWLNPTPEMQVVLFGGGGVKIKPIWRQAAMSSACQASAGPLGGFLSRECKMWTLQVDLGLLSFKLEADAPEPSWNASSTLAITAARAATPVSWRELSWKN